MSSTSPLTIVTSTSQRKRVATACERIAKSNVQSSCVKVLVVEDTELHFIASSNMFVDCSETNGDYNPPYVDYIGAASLEETLRKLTIQRKTRRAEPSIELCLQPQSVVRQFILARSLLKAIFTLLESITDTNVRNHWEMVYMELVKFVYSFSQVMFHFW